MKKIIPFILVLAFVACKKKPAPAPAPTPAPSPAPCTQPTGIKDHTWNPSNTALAKLKFRSDGKYFQNADSSGTWTFKGCDSVYVTRPASNFYYRVKSLVGDTMWIVNPALGELKYYK